MNLTTEFAVCKGPHCCTITAITANLNLVFLGEITVDIDLARKVAVGADGWRAKHCVEACSLHLACKCMALDRSCLACLEVYIVTNIHLRSRASVGDGHRCTIISISVNSTECQLKILVAGILDCHNTARGTIYNIYRNELALEVTITIDTANYTNACMCCTCGNIVDNITCILATCNVERNISGVGGCDIALSQDTTNVCNCSHCKIVNECTVVLAVGEACRGVGAQDTCKVGVCGVTLDGELTIVLRI